MNASWPVDFHRVAHFNGDGRTGQADIAAGQAVLLHRPTKLYDPWWDYSMGRDTAVATLKSYAARIRAHGACALYLLGSTVRNEAHTDSDLDLFVDYNPEVPSSSLSASNNSSKTD